MDTRGVWSHPSLLIVASAVTALTVSYSAVAAPLTIRARTSVSVAVERTDNGVIVRGALRDDADRPVAFERVFLEIPDYPVQTRDTAADGTFEVAIGAHQLALLEGLHGTALPWTVRYSGDRVYGNATAVGAVDLDRAPTSLNVRCDPPTIGLHQGKVLVHTRLSSALGPVRNGDIRVRVGDGAELIGQTDGSGRSTFVIPPDLLGSAGRYAVRARFLGNSLYSATEEHAYFEALISTRLTLRVAREGDLRTGRYRFSGRLSDSQGAVSDATIAVMVHTTEDGGEKPELVTLATTQEAGIYLTAISVRGLLTDRHGELSLRAIYDARDGRHQASISEAVTLEVPPPPGVPARWYLVALAALAVLLLSAQVIRHKLVALVLARFRVWRARRKQPVPPPTATDEDPPLLLPSAPAVGRELRHDWLVGAIVDAHSGKGLPGGTVHLVEAQPGPEVDIAGTPPTSTGANVSLGPLAPGAYRLVVGAPGYLPREMPLTIPHDGRLDGARLGLVAIRRRIRDAYTRAVIHYQGALRWGRDTPREALALTRSVDAGEARALE
ncbi:MAG: hypothetical protein ACI9MR_004879, partial [Myxococcota bacterium]